MQMTVHPDLGRGVRGDVEVGPSALDHRLEQVMK